MRPCMSLYLLQAINASQGEKSKRINKETWDGSPINVNHPECLGLRDTVTSSGTDSIQTGEKPKLISNPLNLL
jgi:hypothetical protein